MNISPPLVAIVILNYNGQNYLEQFLPSVLSTSYSNCEIYVADNASTDGSIDFLKKEYPNVKLILLDKNHGFAGGYNEALVKVEADYYVLLNSDVEVTSGWVTPIIDLMESDDTIAVCQPKIKAFYNKEYFEHAGGAGGWMDTLGYPFCRGRLFHVIEKDYGQYDEVEDIFWASGAAFFIRAKLYHQIRGLDADYFAHMEEIELCWRLKRVGYRIKVVPSSVVYHVGGGTLPQTSPRKTYLNFRNNLVSLLKNEKKRKLFWLIPSRLVLDGVAGVLFLKQGRFEDIWAVVRAHFYIYFNFLNIIKKRAIIADDIERMSIHSPNKRAIYKGSIVWQFYVRNKQYFKELNL